MFTGLVTDIGTLRAVKSNRSGRTFTVRSAYAGTTPLGGPLELGESIACAGACLTVTHVGNDTFDVDATPETISRTTLSDIKVNDRIHLERALRVGDRLGGHYVTGHIDGKGRVTSIRSDDNAHLFTVEAPLEIASLLVEKGSIAIDGVSLTVNKVVDVAGGVSFEVAVIPYTYRETLFHTYAVGREVNLEGDIIGKYVQRRVDVDSGLAKKGGVTWDLLARHDFS